MEHRVLREAAVSAGLAGRAGDITAVVRRWRRSMAVRLRDEQGGTALFLIGAMIGLLAIGFTAVVVLGDAVSDRRQANTSSDSAALAGASYCADQLVRVYETAVSSSNGYMFWAPFGMPVAGYCSGLSLQAASYASKNGSHLTSFRPNYITLTFRATVRETTGVEDTKAHQTSGATATLKPTEGFCVSGGMLGIDAEGWCQTFPTKFNPETGEPLPPVVYSSTASADTRLTDD